MNWLEYQPINSVLSSWGWLFQWNSSFKLLSGRYWILTVSYVCTTCLHQHSDANVRTFIGCYQRYCGGIYRCSCHHPVLFSLSQVNISLYITFGKLKLICLHENDDMLILNSSCARWWRSSTLCSKCGYFLCWGSYNPSFKHFLVNL